MQIKYLKVQKKILAEANALIPRSEWRKSLSKTLNVANHLVTPIDIAIKIKNGDHYGVAKSVTGWATTKLITTIIVHTIVPGGWLLLAVEFTAGIL